MVRINLKKLREQKGKALFLIIPIFLLMVLTVVISSQIQNFQTAINTSVFGTLKEQSTLFQIEKSNPFQTSRSKSASGGARQVSFQQDNFNNNYTQTDLTTIQAIPGIKSASLNSSIPITNISTTDLFPDTKYSINSLSELDSTSASLYTDGSFTYKEGEPIPIILNANTFTTQYEDWGNKTEIDLDFSNFRPGQNGQKFDNPTPVKSKAIEYDKNSLIGKTFTLNFGGFDDIQDYKITIDGQTQKFIKLTSDEYTAKVNALKDAVNKYWNYDTLSKPMTYTFKVVGVVDTEGTRSTYIPQEFANVLMKSYIQNQFNAKTSDPSNDLLDKVYLGLSFDGTQFSGSTGQGFSRRIGGGGGAGAIAFRFQGVDENSDSYNIPGLVIQVSNDGNNTVQGIYSDNSAYEKSAKTASTITIKVNSIYDRANVVKALNDAGYAFQDVSNFEVFNKIQSTIQTVAVALTIAFITITIGVIIFAMLKFVSDSRKEIGIFRAIGMKKRDVLLLFTSQAILYTGVAYLIGLGIGILANIALESVSNTLFNDLIGNTIKQTFNVIVQTDNGNFARIDTQSILIYSGILLLITLVVSLLPAFRASQISPVEAIKGE